MCVNCCRLTTIELAYYVEICSAVRCPFYEGSSMIFQSAGLQVGDCGWFGNEQNVEKVMIANQIAGDFGEVTHAACDSAKSSAACYKISATIAKSR
jgi:hypothetical protein